MTNVIKRNHRRAVIFDPTEGEPDEFLDPAPASARAAAPRDSGVALPAPRAETIPTTYRFANEIENGFTTEYGEEEVQDLIRRIREGLVNQQIAIDDRTAQEQYIRQMFDVENARRGQRGLQLFNEAVLKRIFAAIFGFDLLDPLLKDPTITEIMINGRRSVYVERNGRLQKVNLQLTEGQIYALVDRMLGPQGRDPLSETNPMVNVRLPDGSRVNATHGRLSRFGPTVTIRKFRESPFTFDDLIRLGSITPTLARFLHEVVLGRINIVISGGTGSGKTTLLNAILNHIPATERVGILEDVPELRLTSDNGFQLETVPPNVEGKGEITLGMLLRNALRMRPDRLIIGECRGGEAFQMLQAMNTGHEGSMTTIHANSPRAGLHRIEQMCLMDNDGRNMPIHALRNTIAEAVDLVIQQQRRMDGVRRVVSVVEVVGAAEGDYTLNELFHLEVEGGVERLVATGLQPTFAREIQERGLPFTPLRPEGKMLGRGVR